MKTYSLYFFDALASVADIIVINGFTDGLTNNP